jgi:hypothetical protein
VTLRHRRLRVTILDSSVTLGAEGHKIPWDVRVLDADAVIRLTPLIEESDLDDVMDLMRPLVAFGTTPLTDATVALSDVVFGVLPVLTVVECVCVFVPAWTVLS